MKKQLLRLGLVFVVGLSISSTACDPGQVFGGPGNVDRDSATGFMESFEGELSRRSSDWTKSRDGRGMAGNIFTGGVTYRVPGMNPDEMVEAAQMARNSWGQYESYPTKGSSRTGGTFYSLHFGTHSTHCFIDMMAYEMPGQEDSDGGAEVICLYRIVADD